MRRECTVCKTETKFCGLPIDQAHEQNNAIIKGNGGAVGLIENQGALRRSLVSGSEIACLKVNEFESLIKITNNNFNQNNLKHHEEHESIQLIFFKNTSALVATIKDMVKDVAAYEELLQ